jgi:hypothetical protein
MFQYHYEDRLRPIKTGSALLFGTAIDNALNDLLLGKTKDPVKTFRDEFSLERCEGAEYLKSDYDPKVFTDEELAILKGESPDYQAWACLRKKGRILIEEYVQHIYPKIEHVYAVQKELDDRPGFIDAIMDIDGKKRVLIDHKTSSRKYPYDAVKTDLQLATYAHSEGIEYAGFIVLIKSTLKIQVLIDRVPDELKATMQESLTETEEMIEKKVFPRVLNACNRYYGQSCPYLDLCWLGKPTGLKKEPIPKGKKK